MRNLTIMITAFFHACILGVELDTNQVQSEQPLSRFKRNYVLVGKPDAKLQFSFKYAALRSTNLYAGYTQQMIWHVWNSSRPIQDVIFAPEIFYRVDLKKNWAPYLDLGIYEHNSNGRSGQESRSIDKTYIRLALKGQYSGGLEVTWKLKLSALYGEEEFNEDLDQYIGYLESMLVLTNIFPYFLQDEQLYFRVYTGKKFSALFDDTGGGYELGFNFRFLGAKLLPTFTINYFRGFAEGLLNFRTKTRALRAGLTHRF